MNAQDRDQKFKDYLKTALPPVESTLERDLWPAMLRRMDQRSAALPWFDWALLGLLATLLLVVPGAVPIFLYQF